MDYVITLISHPDAAALGADVIARAARECASAAEHNWLADDIACDVGIDMPDASTARETAARIREAIAPAPVDVVVQPLANRRKRLLIADMDSTIIEQETIDEIAAEIGVEHQVAAITERAMRGEIDFEPALRERVALVKGVDRAALDRVLENRLTLTPGARILATTMAAHGAVTALVSGGFSYFAAPIAARAGFKHHVANVLEFDGDRLTGTVEAPVIGREAKRETLERLRREAGLARADTLAVGDGANDIGMLQTAGLGVAYHAKPAARDAAGAVITHGDLTAILYLQGYARDDLVT